jgi:rhamnopyranosyl-N-acetylglucosaminyl-diphospho-decaprenol beta-1,3/1,4-galactofuranosyltransferase
MNLIQSVSIIIVTHNRINLLLKLIQSFEKQILSPNKIYIIDNASIDGTYQTIKEKGWIESEFIEYHYLKANIGGSGGFAYGLELAISKGAEWVWMMDDDALPHDYALIELMKIADNPNNIYGSTPVSGSRLSWGVMAISTDGSKKYLENVCDMPDVTEVVFLPFLGILIHRNMVEKIGTPDSGFFVAADDVEYTVRAKSIGAKLIQVGRSRIDHPPASMYRINLIGRTIFCLKLPPWKRYYDTRNRLLIAKKHYGKRLYSETIPGVLVRFFAALIFEQQKGAQMWAFFTGFIDGMLGYKGMRHSNWGI